MIERMQFNFVAGAAPDSSTIGFIAYSGDEDKTLWVYFKPNTQWYGIPGAAHLFESIAFADKPGRAYNEFIKGKLPVYKLVNCEAELDEHGQLSFDGAELV